MFYILAIARAYHTAHVKICSKDDKRTSVDNIRKALTVTLLTVNAQTEWCYSDFALLFLFGYFSILY